MKYLLIMQLIFDGYKAGGASVESVKFNSIDDCNKAKAVFLNTMKDSRPYQAKIFRQAECIELKN